MIFAGILADYIVRFLLVRATITWLKLARVDEEHRLERGVWKPVGLLVRALTWYHGMELIGLPENVLNVLFNVESTLGVKLLFVIIY